MYLHLNLHLLLTVDNCQMSKEKKNITTVDNNVEFTTQLLENVPPEISINYNN